MRIALMLLCCLFICGCSRDISANDIQAQSEVSVSTPTPPISSPAPYRLAAEGDLDGDNLADRADITWEGMFAVPFAVDVHFGSGETKSISIADESIEPTAKMFITDVTNDGTSEIVLPNIGGTDTQGTVSCMLIGYDGESLVREDMYSDGLFNRSSSTYVVEMDESYSFKLKSIPTGNEFPLEEIDVSDEVLSRDVFFTAYTVDRDIVDLYDGKKGILVTSWLEYGVYDQSGEKILKAQPYYIYSTLACEDGQWKVLREDISLVEYTQGNSSVLMDAEIDPLKFSAVAAKEGISAAEIAKEYNASIKMIEDIYEVKDYTLGGYDARAIIKVDSDCVTQVVAMQQDEVNSAKEQVYKTIVKQLGDPDAVFEIGDAYSETSPISAKDMWDRDNPIYACWHLDDRTIEIGEEIPGSHTSHWYLAAYQDKLDRSSMFGYDFNCKDCPHEQADDSEQLRVFLDDSLFLSTAEQVLKKYGAAEIEATARSKRAVDDEVEYNNYIVNGLKVLGYDAVFEINSYHDGTLNSGAYRMEFDSSTDVSDVMEVFTGIVQKVDATMTAKTTKSFDGIAGQQDIFNTDSYSYGSFSVSWDNMGQRSIKLSHVKSAETWEDGRHSPVKWYVYLSIK